MSLNMADTKALHALLDNLRVALDGGLPAYELADLAVRVASSSLEVVPLCSDELERHAVGITLRAAAMALDGAALRLEAEGR